MRNVTAKAVVIILAFSCLASAQDFHFYPFTMIDQEMVGSGARARAMGGAFLGLSDDASALTWNPAGLIQTAKTHVAVSGNLDFLRLENDFNIKAGGDPDFAREFSEDDVQLSYASFVSPLRIKGHPFTLAAGYQKSQNFIDETFNKALGLEFFFTGNLIGGILGTTETNTTYETNLNEFVLGFGTGLYGDLAIGGTVSILSGSGTYDYRSALLDTIPEVFGGQVVDSVEALQRRNVTDEVDIEGVKVVGALMYKAENFSAGVRVVAPYELIYDHDMERADTVFTKSISIPGPGLPSASLTTLYRGKTKREVPMTLGFGASVQPTENLVLAADFDYRGTEDATYFVRTEEEPETARDSINTFTLPWSIYYDEDGQPSYYTASGEYIEIFTEYPLAYDNSYQLRIGGEYSLATRFGTIPIRGGFRYSALPYRDVSNLVRDNFDQVVHMEDEFEFELGEQVTRSTITFGAGIHWTQVWLDFAIELHSEEQTQSGFFLVKGEETEDEVFVNLLDYTNTRTRNSSTLILNFTGFF